MNEVPLLAWLDRLRARKRVTARVAWTIDALARALEKRADQLVVPDLVAGRDALEKRAAALGIRGRAYGGLVLSLQALLDAAAEEGLIPRSDATGISPEWEQVYRAVHAKLPQRAPYFHALARFATRRHVEPDGLTTEVWRDYFQETQVSGIHRRPASRYWFTADLWLHLARDGIVPASTPYKPPDPRPSTYAVADLPPRMANEMSAYRAQAARPVDAFRASAKPLRAVSVENREEDLKRLLGYLHQELGLDVAEFRLADALGREHVERFINWLVEKRGCSVSNVARSLVSFVGLARWLEANAAASSRDRPEFVWLVSLTKTVVAASKKRTSSRPVPNLVDLLPIPDRIRERRAQLLATPRIHPITVARTFRDEILFEILIARAPRQINLRRLMLGEHIVREGTAWLLRLQPRDVKTGNTYRTTVPEHVWPVIDEYVRDHRRHFGVPASSGPFFPGGARGVLSEEALRRIVRQWTREVLGAAYSPHVFRHALAWALIEHNDSDYLSAQAILGHRQIDVTLDRYTKLTSEWAGAAFDELIDGPPRPAASSEVGRQDKEGERR